MSSEARIASGIAEAAGFSIAPSRASVNDSENGASDWSNKAVVPDEDVGVQQQLHRPSKRRRSSSGSGSSKSGASTNSPSASPIGRSSLSTEASSVSGFRSAAGTTGVISAIGFPA